MLCAGYAGAVSHEKDMVSNPNLISDIAQRCKSNGLRSLSKGERGALRNLFRKEIRKVAFKPNNSKPSKVLNEFCDHVINEFGATAQVKVVIDSQPYLRKTARRLSNHPLPLASLILYAAWIEHWVNMMVTVAMLRNGCTPDEPLQFLKTQPRFEEKLEKLAKTLGINKIPKKTRDGLIEVIQLRNRHLHFPWEGKSSRNVNKDSQTVRSTVNRCEKILENALSFEHEYFDAPHAKLVSAVFRLR